MSRLVLTSALYDALEAEMLPSAAETCALLWGSFSATGQSTGRFVARELEHIPENAYAIRSPVRAQLNAEFIGHVCNEARRRRESVVFVHSHPDFDPIFSAVDDAGERELAALFEQRTPNLRHAALIYSKFGCAARLLGTQVELEVMVIGRTLQSKHPAAGCAFDQQMPAFTGDLVDRYERQTRAFGAAGQTMLRRLDVGIVGAGGTGSVVASQLAYLGVRSLAIIDNDTVEASNLNRLVGATSGSVGRSKVDTVGGFLNELRPDLELRMVCDKFPSQQTVRTLLNCDVVFCCTDSEGSRHVLNEIAYQYLLPVIDLGTEIDARRTPTVLQVRAQTLSFGLPCHTCTNFLDGDRVRWDLQPEAVRKADPYFRGGGEPAPSVISLNSAAASFAVNILISLATGSPSPRAIKGDMATGLFRAFTADIDPRCVSCSPHRGRLARGSSVPITGLSHAISTDTSNQTAVRQP